MKIAPAPSSSARRASALTRLPLWATATGPPAYWTANGWAFFTWLSAGGGVADVADGGAARQPPEHVGVEDVGHQPHVAVDVERLAVGGDDAGGLLPAVLEGVEAQVGEVGGLFGLADGPDPEDAALVLQLVLDGVVPHEAAEYNDLRLKKPTARQLLAAVVIALGIPAALLALASLPDPPPRPAVAPRVWGVRSCQGALAAGAASVQFDLPASTPIAGFSRLRYGSEGVRDPVGARALVLSAGGCRFAIASAELLTIPDALEAAVRARLDDVPLDGLVLGATHTHAGPGGYWDDEIFERAATGPYDPALRDLIANALAKAIREAAAAAAPARLSVGRAELPALVWNRSSEGIDGRLSVLRLDRPGGAAVGELAVFAAHPTTLGMRNRRLSGDWPGRFMAGGRGVRLFLQGPLGDQSPTLQGTPATPESYGDALSAAVEALRFFDPRGHHHARLRARRGDAAPHRFCSRPRRSCGGRPRT